MRERSRLADLGAAILLLVLVLLFFHQVIFSGEMIYGQDIIEQGYPLTYFGSTMLLSDEAPIWNPYMMSGTPMYSSAPFRPLDLFLRHSSPVTRINAMYIVHAIVACLVMYILMRRWRMSMPAAMVAAIAFAFSGFFIPKIFAGHGGAFTSAVWIPLVILLLDLTIETRKPLYAALTGGVYGIQILGEHPQYVFYTLLALIAFTIYRTYPVALRPLKLKVLGAYFGLVGIVGLFAGGLAAIYILPFAQLTSLSSRGGGTGYEYSSSLSLPPGNFITAVLPNFWGSPAWKNSVMGAIYWDSSLYMGIIPLMLALIAVIYSRHPRSAFFKWLAVGSILIALGGYTPLYRLLYHVPGFNLMRVPAKALILYSFSMSVLAGYGLQTLMSLEPRKHKKLAVMLSAATICSAIAAVGYLVAKPFILDFATTAIIQLKEHPQEFLSKLPGLYAAQIRGFWIAFFFTALGSALIWSIVKQKWTQAAPLALVGLAFADLLIFGSPLVKTVNPEEVYTTGAAEVEFLQQQEGFFRVLPLQHSTFMYSQGMLSGIQSVNGYYPVYPRRYAQFVAAVNRQPMKVDVSADILTHDSPLLDLLNVRYVISNNRLDDEDLRLVFHDSAYIYERETLPRAFLVHSVEIVPDAESALQRVTSPDFDPTKSIVLESPATLPVARFSEMRDSVSIAKYEPRRVEMRVTATAPAYLFLSESNYPGWEATLNGEPVPVLQANHLFRSIYVPTGEHSVVFRYDPRLRKVAARITTATALTLMAICGTHVVTRRRRAKRKMA